jgi:predicted transcriptional regulator
MGSGRGLTIELSAEQVRTIVQRASGVTSEGTPDLAIAIPSLRGVLVDQARRDISYALARGLLVLAAFPADGGTRGLTEVAEGLGMTTSTVHRCLNTLVLAGLLERDGETRRYRRRIGFPHSGTISRSAEKS